jgi:hypothetical protein
MKKDDRFVIASKEGSALSTGQRFVLVDKQTGVNYMFIQCGYAGGLTPLLDAEGKPIVTEI